MDKLGIFSDLDIGSLRVSNRIVISPMCQYSAKDGNATDWHLAHYLQMALSGAGMIVLESTAVSSEGRITLGDLGIYSDQNETKLKKMVSSIKKYSNSFISTLIKLFSLLLGKKTCEPDDIVFGVSQPAYTLDQGSGGEGIRPLPLLEPWSINPKTPILLLPFSISHNGGRPIANPIISESVPFKPN